MNLLQPEGLRPSVIGRNFSEDLSFEYFSVGDCSIICLVSSPDSYVASLLDPGSLWSGDMFGLSRCPWPRHHLNYTNEPEWRQWL